jgi:hypothetical protein
MGLRSSFQSLLEAFVGTGGNVYFQPPSNVQMTYPCIVYQRDTADTIFANNKPYRNTKRYQVTVIDRNPDSEIPDRVASMPLTTHNRFFVAEGLNHDVFITSY